MQLVRSALLVFWFLFLFSCCAWPMDDPAVLELPADSVAAVSPCLLSVSYQWRRLPRQSTHRMRPNSSRRPPPPSLSLSPPRRTPDLRAASSSSQLGEPPSSAAQRPTKRRYLRRASLSCRFSSLIITPNRRQINRYLCCRQIFTSQRWSTQPNVRRAHGNY